MISVVRVGRKKYKRSRGRPVGSGPWGEPTKPICIPESMIPLLVDLLADFINANGLDMKAREQLNCIEERFVAKSVRIKHVVGKVKAESLSSKTRKQISRKAANSKWSKK